MSRRKQLNFKKMHGLGNDILIINGLTEKINLSSSTIQQLSDRHTGIGFDQLIVIEKDTPADFLCYIYNSDGSVAEQCGNGLRCVARFLHENKLASNNLSIKTLSGISQVHIQNYDYIEVSLNLPNIINEKLLLEVSDLGSFDLFYLTLGNPHVVLRIDKISDIDINHLGKSISTHGFFKEGTNVGFMEINHPHKITLRTYERGAGLTFACGSNATAAAVAGIVKGLLNSPVEVAFPKGSLFIAYEPNLSRLTMSGPAENCFEGFTYI